MIIDFHTHIFPPKVIENKEDYLQRDEWFKLLYSDPRAKMASAEELIAEMDSSGVDKAVVFGFAWADMGLCQEANDYVIEAVRRYPKRLIGFSVVNPRAEHQMVQEIERCTGEGMRGVGELMPDGQGFSLDDETTMTPLINAASAHNLPILIHASEPVGHVYAGKGMVTPDILYRFVRRFPGATFVLAHWGGGLPFYELMPEVRAAMANVYYDTAASLLLYDDRIFPLFAGLIPQKILFGTDFPLLKQGTFIERIKASRLPEGTLEKVLGTNAERLLKIRSD